MTVFSFALYLFSFVVMLAANKGFAQSHDTVVKLARQSLILFDSDVSGNRNGSITPYTPGRSEKNIPSGSNQTFGKWAVPYKKESPLVSISKNNMAQNGNNLSELSEALLQKYPDNRIDDYASHRTVSYPINVFIRSVINASNTTLLPQGLSSRGNN